MKELGFGTVKPGELWGSDYEEYNETTRQFDHDRGDGLWIVADYTHHHNHNQDAIVVHWFDRSTYTLHLFKTILEDNWYMHGYEDGGFKLFDENYGIFYKRSLIDHLFGVARKMSIGKKIL